MSRFDHPTSHTTCFVAYPFLIVDGLASLSHDYQSVETDSSDQVTTVRPTQALTMSFEYLFNINIPTKFLSGSKKPFKMDCMLEEDHVINQAMTSLMEAPPVTAPLESVHPHPGVTGGSS